MYDKTHAAYRHNPLMDSSSKQVAFLFGRIAHFIEEADRLRCAHHYQEFAHQNQRAISAIHGLSSFLQSELTPSMSVAWDNYFSNLLLNLNLHAIEPSSTIFEKISSSLREMEQLWKNTDIQSHIMVNANEVSEHAHISNHNAEGANPHASFTSPHMETSTSHRPINVSI